MTAVINRRFQHLSAINDGLVFDLKKDASQVRDGMEAEDIHRFRVETKKLRAFLRLVVPDRHPSLPRRFRRYYQSLGVIRNLQLQEQRFREWAGADIRRHAAYLASLRAEWRTAISQCTREAMALSLPHIESRVREGLQDKLETGLVREFLWKASTRIRKLAAPDATLSEEDMHELRKCLKDLSYNHKYIEHESLHILPPALTAGKEKIEPVLLLLGRFQDYCSGLRLLQPPGDSNEKELIGPVARDWQKEKEKLRHQFRITYLPIFHRLFALPYIEAG